MNVNRTSMLYGTLVLTATSLASQLLGFVYRIFLSRLIGAEIMGLYQLIMPVYAVILSITAVGLTVAVSNLSSEYHARGNPTAVRPRCCAAACAGFLILFAAVAAAVAIVLRPHLGLPAGGRPHPAGPAASAALSCCSPEWRICTSTFSTAPGNIRPPAAVELCEQVIRTGAVLALLVLFLPQSAERTVGLIVLGMILCEVFSAAALALLYRRHMGRADGLSGRPLRRAGS